MNMKKKGQAKKKQKKVEVPEEESDISDLSDDQDSLDEIVSEDEPQDEVEAEDDSDDESEYDEAADKKHKEALNKLKTSDPSFYQFLEENDKDLLNFDASDSDDSDEAGDEANKHVPPAQLEADSEESDYEEADSEGEGDTGIPITLKMVEKWTKQLRDDNSMVVIGDVVKAFQACIRRVTGSEEKLEDDDECKFKVSGSAVFNAVIQMCVLELHPALKRFLKLPTSGTHAQPNKSKKWAKVKSSLKLYVGCLIKLLTRVSSEHIQTVVLKHMHQMCTLVAAFPALSRIALKRVVTMWGECTNQSVRILAFLCIARLACDRQNQQLEVALKLMYVTYVRNSKFVSPNVLPGLNFMRRSLVEMFAIDEAAAYEHVFLYIRQLAIHLRNAITTHKKEAVQTVYNWQYINSLYLWCELLGGCMEVSPLKSLIYPLVQVVQGTVKLVPTTQYYPLRFHCAKMLTLLSRRSRVFIPVLPILIDVLNSYDVNQGNKKVSMKPVDITCILRASKSQQEENGYKDAIMEELFSCILEYVTVESNSIAFPDLVLPLLIQLRAFCKRCKVANYNKKMRSLIDKIEENSRFVENERVSLALKLSNTRAVHNWEQQLKTKGTPLQSFCDSWSKATKQKTAQKQTQSHKLADDFEVPKINKKSKKRHIPAETKGETELFPSSDEDDLEDDKFGFQDDSDEDVEQVKKPKRSKKEMKKPVIKSKKLKSSNKDDILPFPDTGDIVEEFKLSDYE